MVSTILLSVHVEWFELPARCAGRVVLTAVIPSRLLPQNDPFRRRGKTEEEVLALLDDPAGVFDMSRLKQGGWISDTKYLDELNKMLRGRTGGAPDELRFVTLSRYTRTRPQSLGVDVGIPTIAIVRASGSISRGSGGSGIQNEDFIRQIKRIQKDRRVRAVVLRIDSPGGDALASDLMWREIRLLARSKPVVASMVDVAASGGYYMAMAADKIVAEPLTLTGAKRRTRTAHRQVHPPSANHSKHHWSLHFLRHLTPSHNLTPRVHWRHHW